MIKWFCLESKAFGYFRLFIVIKGCNKIKLKLRSTRIKTAKNMNGSENNNLPDLSQLTCKPVYEAREGRGCTDVYFFGVSGAGKTGLLTGLMGAEYSDYTFNYLGNGGAYAAALKQYAEAGVMPGYTPYPYTAAINCRIEEKNGKSTKIHYVNFIEMSGQLFSYRIANCEQPKLEDMGYGVERLFRNGNRKVLFLIVDPTRDIFNLSYNDPEYDMNGNVIGVNPSKLFVDQTTCLAKFISLFEMQENKNLMKKVDAIHFIVTKADILGDDEETRKMKARDLLLDKYGGIVQNLIGYCRRTNRINYVTDFRPMVYPFSMGQFYDDGTFKYDKSSSLKIIDVLRHYTIAIKEEGVLGKVRDCLVDSIGKPKQ